jgi:hypothetical protein
MLTEVLPSEILILVLAQLPLVRNIKGVKRTCRALRDAAPPAEKEYRCRTGKYEHARDPVTSVAAVPAGGFVTGSWDGTVKVWRDGACERTIQAHTWNNGLNAVAVLPGGARFISASQVTAKLFTFGDELERTFAVGSRVCSVAALPDGVHFVVGTGSGEDDEVLLYHVDGMLVHTFKGNSGNVWALAVTPDGKHIISGGDDLSVKVWNVASKSLFAGASQVFTCEGHAYAVTAVAVMPDGQRIVSGDYGGEICVWLLNGALKNTFELHDGTVQALVALPDNQHALSGSADKTVKLFNVNDGSVLRTFTHHASDVWCLALLPDGLRFVSGSSDKTARIAEIW